MSVYSETDAKVVKAACKKHNINYNKQVSFDDKATLIHYTGLSLSLVCRALTNIRKSV
jgi:hypothetical protein